MHWIGSMIFAAIVGIANYSIYMATIGMRDRELLMFRKT